MSRTAIAIPFLAVILFTATFAHASGYAYEYDNYDYDYRNYDSSIDHSFNNYDSSNTYYGYNRGHRYSYVSNPIFTTPVYTYPYVAGTVYPTTNYVQLAQTPYTGFDFGPVGNAMYWLGMLMAAGLAAYALLYGIGNTYPQTLAREVVAAARNQLRSVRSLVR